MVKRLAQESWVANPYGLDQSGDDEEQGEEAASFDERGCHTIYSAGNEPLSTKVAALAKELVSTRQTARTAKQIPRLDAYGLGPSLWLGANPLNRISEGYSGRNGNILKFIHEHLWKLTCPVKDGHPGDDSHVIDGDGFDFYSRALVFQACDVPCFVSRSCFVCCRSAAIWTKAVGASCCPRPSSMIYPTNTKAWPTEWVCSWRIFMLQAAVCETANPPEEHSMMRRASGISSS